jgi:hypothetical protein
MAQKNGRKMTDRGRDAKTGEFTPTEKARERADTTTAETVKKRRGQTEPARRNEQAEK